MVAEAANHTDECVNHRITYSEHYDNKDEYTWCTVPDTGYDVLLFPAIAVLLACLFQGKYSTTMVLIAGGVLQAFMFPTNGGMGRLGNSIAWWLGIQPYELFLYVFLPPLLLDAAVRIDFFLFKKAWVKILTLAFLVVAGSCGLLIPIMLYVLDLRSDGWTWQYVALFGSMCASTDAVAIVATMKTSGGPKSLRLLLEGESLLNDASSITLFTIFLSQVEDMHNGHVASGGEVLGSIVKQTVWLAVGGALIGLAFGITMRYMLRWMRHLGAGIEQQVAMTFAIGYLSYYTANAPAGVSGVIAVAVFGLYGAATSKWDMSVKVEESGAFDAFWDAIAFIVNAIVFFYSGVACINFFVRSAQELQSQGQLAAFTGTLWRFPLVYLIIFIVRFLLICLFRPLFRLSRQDLPFKEIAFATVAGLRGSVSLILTQAVVIDPGTRNTDPNSDVTRIKAEIVLWTAGFVLLTLVINAPLLPFFLRVSGLASVADSKRRMRKRAVHALLTHTNHAIRDLRNDEDEMLRGVDWGSVEKYVDLADCYQHYLDPCYVAPKVRVWYLPWTWCYKPAARKKDSSTHSHSYNGSHHSRGTLGKPTNRSMNSSGLDSNFTMMEADRVFGRTSEWSPPADLETGAVEDSETGSGSDSDDGSSDHKELPFLARESVMGARASRERANEPVKLNRESQAGPMKLPEAVEAITGVDASHLPHSKELKQDIKRDSRKGKDTAAPSQMQKSSSIGSADSQALSPRARSAAKAVQAAACKVVITPGGPLPVPAGAAWSDSISATNNLSLSYGTPAQDRLAKATRALKQLRTGAPGGQNLMSGGSLRSLPSPRTALASSTNSSAPSIQSVHDSQMSLPASNVEMTNQGRSGILRAGTAPGDVEQGPTPRGGSPTVSWHRSVMGGGNQRRPPLSNIFPAAGRHSPEKPRSNLGATPLERAATAGPEDTAAGGSTPAEGRECAPPDDGGIREGSSRADVRRSSTMSWPRSAAHGEPGRPSLLAAFPSAGQAKPPPGQAGLSLPKSSSGDDLVKDSVKRAATQGAFSSTMSWPRAVAQGTDARPSLLQAFPDAGQPRAPVSPTIQQRLASQRLTAMRNGSMQHSPTSSWNRSIMHGADKHRSLFEAFSGMREGGENPESVSTFGGATAQRYAAAARSGSMPHDPGSSWPRSVMHGPDKHRSLFEAFGNLKPPPAGGDDPGASQSFMRSAIEPPDTRPPLKSAFDNTAGMPDNERTWAAGDQNTRALGVALKRQLSEPGGSGSSQPPSASGHGDDNVKGAIEFEEEKEMTHHDATVFHSSELTERRVRLAIGLKRYFHSKRMEGLLSTGALRVLDNAMDTIIDKPNSTRSGWSILEKDATGGGLMRWFAHLVYLLRKTVIRLRRRRPDSNSCWQAVRRGLAWPLLQAGQLAHVVLSKAMLMTCEVALEYMLGLTYSPQVQLMRANAFNEPLLQEVDRELGEVWRFILEREVEAPERFQAIQSYRATMAVLRKQADFVKQLFDSGVVEDMERDELLTPIDRRERQLSRKGPVWRSPMAFDVLRNLPFLRHVPPRAVEVVLRHGQLHMCRNQEMVRSGKDGRGLFIVINGLVRIGYRDPLGNTQEYFLGTGGISGLFHSLTGEHLPGGRLEAIAEGNALGKGPVVFEVHQSAIEIIRSLAANGDATFQQVEIDMFRMAALFVVERLKPWLMTYLAALLATAAPAPFNIKFPARDNDDGMDGEDGPFRADQSFTGALSTTDFENASMEDIQEVGRARVWDAYLQLVQSLTSSELVELPANTGYRHCSSAVLLRGVIRTSGSHCSVVCKTPAGKESSPEEDEMLEYKAPFILPWIVLNKEMSPDQPESFVPFISGPEGAILMVCTRENAPGVKEASVLDLSSLSDDLPKKNSSSDDGPKEGAAANGTKAPEQEESDPVADLPAKPSLNRVSTMPRLARHSITRAPPLALNASDTAAEMVSPEVPDDADKDSLWWRNRKPPTGASKHRKGRDGSGRAKDQD